MFYLQDIWTRLFNGATKRDPGTLFWAKQYFSKKTVSGEIKACFNHATDLLKVVLLGYVLGIAMEKMGTRSIDQKPADLPDDDDRDALIQHKCLVDSVMELAWPGELMTVVG